MTSSLEGEGGGSRYPPKVMTSFSHDMMTRGRGGSGYPPKVMTSFMNSPLSLCYGHHQQPMGTLFKSWQLSSPISLTSHSDQFRGSLPSYTREDGDGIATPKERPAPQEMEDLDTMVGNSTPWWWYWRWFCDDERMENEKNSTGSRSG